MAVSVAGHLAFASWFEEGDVLETGNEGRSHLPGLEWQHLEVLRQNLER